MMTQVTLEQIPVAETPDLMPASVYDECSVGPSFRSICSRWCFSMTNMIQVGINFRSCTYFRWARVCSTNTRPNEICSADRPILTHMRPQSQLREASWLSMKGSCSTVDHAPKLSKLFRVRISGFWVPGFRFRVSGPGLQVSVFGFEFSGCGFRVPRSSYA